MKDIGEIAETIQGMIHESATGDEIYKTLSAIAFTVGGMVIYFEREERSYALVNLTQSMAMGLQNTAKSIGEPSELEIIVGNHDIN